MLKKFPAALASGDRRDVITLLAEEGEDAIDRCGKTDRVLKGLNGPITSVDVDVDVDVAWRPAPPWRIESTRRGTMCHNSRSHAVL
jgi:hypothetical protein